MTGKPCNSKERENNNLMDQKNKSLRKSDAHIKVKSTVLFIIILIVLAVICIIGVANNVGIIKDIFGPKIQQEEEEEVQFVSYQIYDNKDSNELKIIVTINSETGIEYVKKADGTTIQANNKTQIGLDYIMAVETEEPIIIKEVGKEEVTEKIIIEEAGNEENPVIIMNADQLLNIQKNTDKLFKEDIPRNEIHYKIGANIDLSGAEWTPIGTQENPFKGILDGDSENYTISNLTYSNEEATNTGLFAHVTGTLKNIKLDNCEVTGKENVGVLVGNNTGEITNIEITNAIVNGTIRTGILTGYNSGTGSVSKNTIQGQVVAIGDYVGGVVGYNDGIISENMIDATIQGVTNVGGIVGYTNNEVRDNIVNGTITATGNTCGGIAGYAWSNVTGNTSNANIYGIENVGGCIGEMRSSAHRNFVCERNITTGNIEGKTKIGGVVGHGYIYIDGGKAYGYLTISKCYSTGNIVATENQVGGIVGNMYVAADGGNWNGYSTGNIYNCFTLGSVRGKSYCGGLVGHFELYAWRRGRGYGNVINNYVACSVIKTDDETLILEEEDYIEPFIGKFNVSLAQGSFNIPENNYYCPETTGLTESTYGTSKSLANMYSQSEFTNWDFENIWTIEEGITMPYLKELDKPAGVNK